MKKAYDATDPCTLFWRCDKVGIASESIKTNKDAGTASGKSHVSGGRIPRGTSGIILVFLMYLTRG